MGVTGLWDALQDCMRRGYVFVNKRLAVDASIWIFEAVHQPALGKMSLRDRVGKVVFERVIELIRLGSLPVLVFDEKPPEAKGKVFGSGWSFLSDLINLLNAIGVPVLRTGTKLGLDAEAVCAYLNSRNLVDAVLSNDSDSLLYGAKIVLKDCKLFPKPRVEVCDMETVTRKTKLDRYGLIAVSLFTGSDFSDGVKSIGSRRALKIVGAITSKKCKDSTFSSHQQLNSVMATFLSPLSEEEKRLANINKCEKRCVKCGHRCSKDNHGPRGCKECGTHSIKRGGNGKGFCLQILERGNTTCPCDFHKKASEREIARVKRHARLTRPELEKDFAITISTFLTKIPIELQEKARELNFSWWTRFEDDNEDAFDILRHVLRRKSNEIDFSEILKRRLIPLRLEVCIRKLKDCPDFTGVLTPNILKWTKDRNIKYIPIALHRPRGEKRGEEKFWLVDFDCLERNTTPLTSSMRTIRASLIEECVPKLLRRVKDSRSKKKTTPESTRRAIKTGSQRLMTNFMKRSKKTNVVVDVSSSTKNKTSSFLSPSKKSKKMTSSFVSPTKKRKSGKKKKSTKNASSILKFFKK